MRNSGCAMASLGDVVLPTSQGANPVLHRWPGHVNGGVWTGPVKWAITAAGTGEALEYACAHRHSLDPRFPLSRAAGRRRDGSHGDSSLITLSWIPAPICLLSACDARPFDSVSQDLSALPLSPAKRVTRANILRTRGITAQPYPGSLADGCVSQQTRYIIGQWWADVVDGGPTLNQHWVQCHVLAGFHSRIGFLFQRTKEYHWLSRAYCNLIVYFAFKLVIKIMFYTHKACKQFLVYMYLVLLSQTRLV